MKEISRRNFLRLATTVGIGAAVGIAEIPASLAVNNITEELTGHLTGNSDMTQKVQEECATQDCSQGIPFTAREQLRAIVVGPIEEEFVLRAMPSIIVSNSEKSLHPIKDVLEGTGGVRLSRRELLGGLMSSVLFGIAHNFTDTGFNTQRIPASQFLGGFVLWYLQRKRGFLGNVSAHMTFNAAVISQIRK